MKALLSILIILGILWCAKEIYSYYVEVRDKAAAAEKAESGTGTPTPSPAGANDLPAMAPSLEASLEAARGQGASGLKAWLKQYRHQVQDPRLADIELDYVIMVGGRNYTEAKKVFAGVKARTPTDSPVYPKIEKLGRTYD
jgi:hypothetical protein